MDNQDLTVEFCYRKVILHYEGCDMLGRRWRAGNLWVRLTEKAVGPLADSAMAECVLGAEGRYERIRVYRNDLNIGGLVADLTNHLCELFDEIGGMLPREATNF